jgi:hypothetical protein
MSDYSYFLFARPSFGEGIAGILYFGNTLTEYNVSSTPEQADTLALVADWLAVGGDLRGLMVRSSEGRGDGLAAEPW